MKTVKIGPYQYNLSITDHVGIDEGFDTDKWGDVRHDLLRIRISGRSVERVKLITLFHEALHAIGFIMGTSLPEEVVEPISPLLVQFLEENGVDLSPLDKLIEDAE